MTQEEAEQYERRIEQLENSIKELRKDTRVLEVQQEEATKLKPIAGWQDGFFIQSPDGANKLVVGGYVHFDGRYFTSPGDDGTSQFLLRRARIDFRGKFLKNFEFRFMPDFAGGRIQLQDAYLNANYVPWLNVQGGKYKTPFGIERLEGANAIVFIERSLSNNLVPNRDLGFMAHGNVHHGALGYQFAVLDGVPDGQSDQVDLDINDPKTFAGRLFAQPFRDTTLTPLRGFGIGVAGTYGREDGSQSTPDLGIYRTDGQQIFFSYSGASSNQPAAVADGEQSRFSPQGNWYWGPWGMMWDYVWTGQEVARGSASKFIQANAFHIQTSYVLTGEANSYSGVTPRNNFNPFRLNSGAWGAFEVKARFAQLQVNNDAFADGFADPTKSAKRAQAWAVGANWYLNRMVRLMLEFDRTTFDGGAAGGDRDPEGLVASRVQFVF